MNSKLPRPENTKFMDSNLPTKPENTKSMDTKSALTKEHKIHGQQTDEKKHRTHGQQPATETRREWLCSSASDPRKFTRSWDSRNTGISTDLYVQHQENDRAVAPTTREYRRADGNHATATQAQISTSNIKNTTVQARLQPANIYTQLRLTQHRDLHRLLHVQHRGYTWAGKPPTRENLITVTQETKLHRQQNAKTRQNRIRGQHPAETT